MKYYAIAENNRVTNNFPDKEYAIGWFNCITNQYFIKCNNIDIVSEDELKQFI